MSKFPEVTKKIKKIKPYGRTYWSRYKDLAGRWMSGTCKTCGSPLMRNYICQYCYDPDPEGDIDE